MTQQPLLIATRSHGKLLELFPIFSKAGLRVEDLETAGIEPRADEDQIEQFPSFAENALAKARYFHGLARRAVVADDSGLEVAALGGAPGVRSRRWCGDLTLAGEALDLANNALLLRRLDGADDRSARFVCAAAFVDGDVEIVELGETRGVIGTEPRGGIGFGYDPLFLSADLGRTFAEIEASAKEHVSHRGRAFAKLVARILARR